MKLIHRDLTIELTDDDPRVPAIELLLFGKTLSPAQSNRSEPAKPPDPPPPAPAPPADPPPPDPPPADAPASMPAPAPAPAPAAAEPPPRPRVEVPSAYRSFWWALTEPMRRELALVAEAPRAAGEIESALGIQNLQPLHTALNKVAEEHQMPHPLVARGREGNNRKFHLREELAPVVLEMAARDKLWDDPCLSG